jgi:hypothetical protein
MELSKEQKQIINAPIDKNIRIIASAGSGKTTTLIQRILYLIKNHNLHLHEIILTTFTKDAAEVMKDKIKKNIHLFYNFMCGTIDSIARKILHINKILDENVQLMSVSEYIHRVIKFSKTIEGEKYFKKFKYIFIDEYQDIDYYQYIFFKRLNQLGLVITVVGDDSQNIYSFRQSDVNYLIKFDEYFTNTQTFYLTKNYRSTNEIIKLANQSIQINKNKLDKVMLGTDTIGSLPMVIKANFNNYDSMILTSILKKIKTYPLHDIAILSRNNFLLLKIENILYKYGIANVLLRDDDIRVKKKENHITLSTIHKSKGLEFDLVYIIGCDDSFFPRMKDFLRIEEERRLFYVATTRAKSRLYYFYLSDSMSRFLTEIPKELLNWENAKEEDKKLSDIEMIEYKTGITEIIKNLRGEDYIRLRNKGILPNVRFDKSSIDTSIYPNEFKWTKFVKKENLYTEYGNYFDTILTRFILEASKQTIFDKAAFKVLNNIQLDKDQINLIKKYKYNFIYNFSKIIDNIDNFDDTNLIKLEDAKKCIKKIEDCDKNLIINFVNYLKKNIKNYGNKYADSFKLLENGTINIEELFLSRFNYDNNKLNEISNSYIKYTSSDINTMDILTDIFNISKCNSLTENRLRMLYINITEENIDDYQLLIRLLKENFLPWVLKHNKIECKKYVNYDIYHGECDLVCDDTLIDYKCSENTYIQIEWIIQLLCYTQMLRDENYIINKIGIFNILTGKLFIADISKWSNEKGKQLFEYLISLQEKMIAKDFKLESELIDSEENIFNIKFVNIDINPFIEDN